MAFLENNNIFIYYINSIFVKKLIFTVFYLIFTLFLPFFTVFLPYI